MKLFSEIKRVVGQFFETEFFYRWRKITYCDWYDGHLTKTYGRALDHLNNTWDGDTSMLNILNDKIFHMYVNLRKYGSTVERELPRDSILENGTAQDKYITFFRGLDEKVELKRDSNDKNLTTTVRESCIYVPQTKSTSNVESRYSICKYTTTNKKTKTTFSRYCIERATLEDSGKKRTVTVLEYVGDDFVTVQKEEAVKIRKHDCSIDFEEKPKSLKEIKDAIKKLSGSQITDEDLFYDTYSVSLELEDYIKLSDKLKKKVIGRLPGLHSLWQFRRMINKLYDLDEKDIPYYKEAHAALKNTNDSEEEKKIIRKLRNEFIKYKKEYAREIADFFVDHCQSWYD